MKFIKFLSTLGIILSINYSHGQSILTDSLDFYVEKTLKEMRMGGIYDHIGFGFHRYSTGKSKPWN